MRSFLTSLLVMCAAIPCVAEVPPLEVPIGEMVEGIACSSDPTQTYTLFIPTAFSNDRTWPVLLVFDPRGRSLLAAELFREAAETYGWIIVSSDNTRSDGPWEPNRIALQALWPEIHTRLPIDGGRIYAAGFSGGAAVAFSLSKVTQKLAGIVACGGRFFPDNLSGNQVPVFSTAGDLDFNYRETHLLDDFLAEQGNPHRLVVFEGPHTWMPPSVALDAVTWFEILAMQGGQREVDENLIRSSLAKEMAKAESLAAGGRVLEAVRRLREIEGAYDGLADTTAAQKRAKEIEATTEFKEQTKAFKRSSGFERRCDESVNNGLAALRTAEVPPPVTQLAREFGIGELQKRAETKDVMGYAAQRCINALYTGVSFYVPRDTMAEKRYAHAETAYELAVLVRGDDPVVWYNLACARAHLGQEKSAVEALANSLKFGFNRYELLETDTDLDPLRGRDDFKALLATVPAS